MPSVAILDSVSAKQNFSVGTDAAGFQMARALLDDSMPLYFASANFTPTATGAVTMISIVGNALKTIRVRYISISGVSTALGQSIFALQRTSALGAGGTVVNPTVAKNDSRLGPSSSTTTVAHYTSTLKATGTIAGGPIHTWNQFLDTVTTPTVTTRPPNIAWPIGGVPGTSIILSGAADFLEIQNVTPANLGAGTVLAYTIAWTEDNS